MNMNKMLEELKEKARKQEEEDKKKLSELAGKLAAVEAELAEATADKEALLHQLKEIDEECRFCKYNDLPIPCPEHAFGCKNCKMECPCSDCYDNTKWEWKGRTE